MCVCIYIYIYIYTINLKATVISCHNHTLSCLPDDARELATHYLYIMFICINIVI